jgi:peptidoglycan/LPS O-acetylase OafA/YrhL
LLTGCLIAITFQSEEYRSLFLKWARQLFWPSLVYLSWVTIHPSSVASPLECAAWAAVILAPGITATRFFSLRPLVWLGRISYSVYVWNVFTIVAWTSLPDSYGARWLLFLIPIASYYCIEKPSIAAGARISFLLFRRKEMVAIAGAATRTGFGTGDDACAVTNATFATPQVDPLPES